MISRSVEVLHEPAVQLSALVPSEPLSLSHQLSPPKHWHIYTATE